MDSPAMLVEDETRITSGVLGTRVGRNRLQKVTEEPKAALFWEQRAWEAQAACRGLDTDIFFVARGKSTRAAKAICTECPVRQDCLDWAVDTEQRFGVWGGMTDRERKVYSQGVSQFPRIRHAT